MTRFWIAKHFTYVNNIKDNNILNVVIQENGEILNHSIKANVITTVFYREHLDEHWFNKYLEEFKYVDLKQIKKAILNEQDKGVLSSLGKALSNLIIDEEGFVVNE